MSGAGSARSAKDSTGLDQSDLEQIEYLLYQSTQGLHFMFENSDIRKILKKPDDPSDKKRSLHIGNMKKVQGLLSGLLDRPSMDEKKTYMERLPQGDFELLVRAYFQLVENTILAHSDLRH
jgi:hypothetical protein